MKSRHLGRCLFALWLLAGAVAAHGQSITGFSQNYGAPGAQISIFGSGFLGATQVRFNQSIADFLVISSGQIRATVPTNGVTGSISVTVSFTATSAQIFYVAPRITRFFSTTSGTVVAAVGQQLQVEGANFLSGNTTVTFGSVTVPATGVAITAEGENSLLFVNVPAGAVTGPLRIDNYGGTFVTTTNLVVGNGLVISSFAPPSGTTNTQVILDGGNFTGVTGVTFNGANAPNFFVTAPNQLHVTVPPGATTGPIGVQKPGVSSVSSSNFVVTGIAPIVTGFTPAAGKAGDPVVIEGVYFTTATSVTFNGTTVTSFNVTADTQIHTTVPPGATAGPIRVFNSYGSGVSSSNFLFSPIIESFDPVSGPVGKLVNIFGVNFAGMTSVRFGGVSAPFTTLAQNQIAAVVPSGASTGPITVVGLAGASTTSSNFTVSAGGPLITGFTPASGRAGDRIQITGANFTDVTNVLFNGVSAVSFGVTSDSQINDVIVPPAATTGPISVIGPGGTAVSSNDFFLPPRLAGLTPTSGIVGSTVTIDGTNFTGVSAVEFTAGDSLYLPAGFTLTATQIVATVPTNALTGPLRITAPAGPIITTNAFAVLPKIYSVTPLAGPAGTPVTISGNGFNTVTNVRFGSYDAVFTNSSTTEILATVPASGAIIGPVSVATAAGTDTNAENFFVTVAADLVLRLTVAPAPGLLNRPLTNTLAVSNAGPSFATSVRITNTVPANAVFVSFTNTAGQAVRTNNLIIWTIPVLTNQTGATLTVVVTPTTTNLLSYEATATAAETDGNVADNQVFATTPVITAAPIITDFSPASGAVGTNVQITGSNFIGVSVVSFNGAPTIAFVVVSDSQIEDAIVPVAATTGPITVVGPGGSATSTNFFYLPPRLTRLTPTNGLVGSSVTLTGVNFTGVSAVEFTAGGGAFLGTSFTTTATRIVAVVPTNALTGPLRITAPGGVIVSTNSFLVQPKIYSLTPLTGPAGTPVTISGNGFNTVTNVRFNGINAVFTNLSTTEVVAVTPPGAATGPISLSTAAGTTNSAETFVVVPAADLSLRFTVVPVIGLLNQSLTCTLVASNAGSLPATSVRITNTVPANAQFVSFTNTAGLATRTNSTILWTFSVLPDGTGAALTVIVTATNTDTLLYQAGGAAAEVEANTADNTAFLSVPVVTDAQRTLSIQRATNETGVELAWPVSSAIFQLQQTPGLPPGGPAAWLNVGEVGRLTNSNGVFHVFSTNTAGEPQFFRLKYP